MPRRSITSQCRVLLLNLIWLARVISKWPRSSKLMASVQRDRAVPSGLNSLVVVMFMMVDWLIVIWWGQSKCGRCHEGMHPESRAGRSSRLQFTASQPGYDNFPRMAPPGLSPGMKGRIQLSSPLNTQTVECSGWRIWVLHPYRRPGVQINGLVDRNGETSSWPSYSLFARQYRAILCHKV